MSTAADPPESDSLASRYLGHDRVRRIGPSRGLRLPDWKELWAYRSLFWILVLRDVKVRHKQTVLGAAWAVLQPALQMALLTVVFGRFAGLSSDGHPYALFVLAALIPWSYFSNALGASAGSVLGSAQLVRRVYFPRIFVPVASAAALLVDLAIALGILILLLPLLGPGWSPRLLALPLLAAGLLLTAASVGALLAALAVYYRDFRNLVPFLLQFWLFATPVVYSARIFPERWQWLVWLNPMAGFVEGFRSALLDRPFEGWALLSSGSMALALALIGFGWFQRVERRFADVI